MSNPYRTKFLVSLAVLAVTLLLQAAPALAACRTHTYYIGNRTYTCNVCCDARGNCTSDCY